MIIGKHEAIKEEKLGGEGIGSAQMYHWLGGENCPNLGLLATITLEPGTTVSDHTIPAKRKSIISHREQGNITIMERLFP